MRPRFPIARFGRACFAFMLALTMALAFASGARAGEAGLVAPGAVPRAISTRHVFTEGPVADSAGRVYFTDIPTSKIYLWDPATDKITLHKDGTGGANGLYFDPDGAMVACRGSARKVSLLNARGRFVALADGFNGKKLNSPNDCWIDPKGGIYFTDPRYGHKRDDLEQGGEHVYYIKPETNPGSRGMIRVIDDMKRPNGIIGTPDGKTLYVSDHGGEKTWRYAVNDDGTLTGKKLFAGLGSDGMTLDERGNVYMTETNIEVFAPDGRHLTTIELPQQAANVTFGGKDFKTLVATCRSKVYALDMNVKGAGR